MCQRKNSEGASLREEKAYLNCLMTKNRPEGGLQMAYRIIHHVQWQYHTLSLVNKLPVGGRADP